ncbi:DUF2530 domain-containing protein [Qaidamihabitans albus]|uniref:DUF2530 domain-containing protein n=1 Tax=Qaidamihabitans albus TaxID=2795733 RepID=UPI0018F1DF93|nr:DUF2530 domain-containing protein [Qaidamihabitans albus]
MTEPSNSRGVPGRLRPPPDLPKSLVDLWPVVIVGTSLWFIAFVVLLLAGVDGLWRWTTLGGGGLGFVGMAIMAWQRAASRRGSRGAQRGL